MSKEGREVATVAHCVLCDAMFVLVLDLINPDDFKGGQKKKKSQLSDLQTRCEVLDSF